MRKSVILISSIEELQCIGSDATKPLDGNYRLADDIDAEVTSRWNDGEGFTPIGNSEHPFLGSFDGEQHVIKGLVINLPEQEDVGLFGKIESTASIKNVGLKDCIISGSEDVGGLVGVNTGGTIINCHVTGKITGENFVGGFVGKNLRGTIRDCHVTGAVKGNITTGGLVGENKEGITTNCYTIVDISGSAWSGGLVGNSLESTLTDCYATGDVKGKLFVGGLVGGSTGVITNCYATGKVTGDILTGGLVGGSTGVITNGYATGKVMGAVSVGGLAGSNHGVITNSYATGEVIGIKDDDDLQKGEGKTGGDRHKSSNNTENEKAGGLVGENCSGTVANCYAMGNVTGVENVGGLVGWNFGSTIANCYVTGTVKKKRGVGGLIGWHTHGSVARCYWHVDHSRQIFETAEGGRTKAQMTDPHDEDTYLDWNFSTIWAHDTEAFVNGGYPYLQTIPLTRDTQAKSRP